MEAARLAAHIRREYTLYFEDEHFGRDFSLLVAQASGFDFEFLPNYSWFDNSPPAEEGLKGRIFNAALDMRAVDASHVALKLSCNGLCFVVWRTRALATLSELYRCAQGQAPLQHAKALLRHKLAEPSNAPWSFVTSMTQLRVLASAITVEDLAIAGEGFDAEHLRKARLVLQLAREQGALRPIT